MIDKAESFRPTLQLRAFEGHFGFRGIVRSGSGREDESGF